mmetsp:Transcript_10776/g.22412  ORF Transcript_10776/g.22412 Transcript_10776/m.22412 type:complete len:567 (+) Transcript_10776:196-1896(+)
MSARPDSVASNIRVKSEPVDDALPPLTSSNASIPPNQTTAAATNSFSDDEDEDDPIIRSIDVYISPQLSPHLHLLQFPLQSSQVSLPPQNRHPTTAKLRPHHRQLSLSYLIPPSAKSSTRQLPDVMCMNERTFSSTAIRPVTHMALGKLDKSGKRLDVVPVQREVFQMRPSFHHLHMHDDDDEDEANNAASASEIETKSGKQKPIMFQKKESERAALSKRKSYSYQKAMQESEEWVELDVHTHPSDQIRKETMRLISCSDREKIHKLAKSAKGGGYVRSLNYLDSVSGLRADDGDGGLENISEWSAFEAMDRNSYVTSANGNATSSKDGDGDGDGNSMDADDHDNNELATPANLNTSEAMERATAELATKLTTLLQNGNGTMIPYRVIRSRFHADNVPDDMLTTALSSCAVLVRGNFALKSTLAQFLRTSMGGGESRRKLVRELRDFILLLLNMHGRIQRERLIYVYETLAKRQQEEEENDDARRNNDYGVITTETITFILRTVAKKTIDCWEAKVEDDEDFAGMFPKVAACHGVYWIKKKEMMKELVELYECAGDDAIVDNYMIC